MTNLSRFEQFLVIPTEDIAARSHFALSQSETDELHTLAVNGQVSWYFYHQINNAEKADFIYRRSGKERGWSIAFIRKQLSRTESRTFRNGDEEICENVSFRLWPKGLLIERTRSREDPITIIHEVEWVMSPETDLESFWSKNRQEFEAGGLDLLQRFPKNQAVQDLCYLPGHENFSARIIVSAGQQRRELVFPIAVRYKRLLRKIADKYTLDSTSSEDDKYVKPLQLATTEEIQEVLAGLWRAVRDYDEAKDIPVPAYIQKKLYWHMGEQFKQRSIETVNLETGEISHILKDRMDRTGGSIGDPLPDENGPEGRTLGETIPDSHAVPPDQQILLQQILDSLIDETDKQIVHLFLQGVSQKEISKELKISQPAISKRLKKLGKALSN